MTTGMATHGNSLCTGLLVSVRDAVEAQTALAAGADLIDVKEPSRGALGVPDRSVVEQIVRVVGGRVAVSVALGELNDWAALDSENTCPKNRAATLVQAIPQGVAFAKFGLAGCGGRAEWPRIWRRAVELLPRHVSPVAVVYADWASAGAPRPDEILQQAGRLDCPAVLVDTFDKSAGGLTEHWPLETLGGFVDRVQSEGIAVVLAGSLSFSTLDDVLDLGPDYVAVRGAVCETGRTGQVSQTLVRQLADMIATHAAGSRSRLGSKFWGAWRAGVQRGGDKITN